MPLKRDVSPWRVGTYMYTVYSVYNSVLESEIKTCTWTNVHVHVFVCIVL